jgi:hypothetical protein
MQITAVQQHTNLRVTADLIAAIGLGAVKVATVFRKRRNSHGCLRVQLITFDGYSAAVHCQTRARGYSSV